jgi:hypothetical protein
MDMETFETIWVHTNNLSEHVLTCAITCSYKKKRARGWGYRKQMDTIYYYKLSQNVHKKYTKWIV